MGRHSSSLTLLGDKLSCVHIPLSQYVDLRSHDHCLMSTRQLQPPSDITTKLPKAQTRKYKGRMNEEKGEYFLEIFLNKTTKRLPLDVNQTRMLNLEENKKKVFKVRKLEWIVGRIRVRIQDTSLIAYRFFSGMYVHMWVGNVHISSQRIASLIFIRHDPPFVQLVWFGVVRCCMVRCRVMWLALVWFGFDRTCHWFGGV